MTKATNQQILEEATAWFVEFRATDSNAHQHGEFIEWLRRSPEHIGAYLEVSRTYVQLPGEGDLPRAETERLLNKARARLGQEVTPLNRQPRLSEPVLVPGRRRMSPSFALAASVVLLLLGALTFWSLTQRSIYVTQAGEERTLALADGSRIKLNGRTRLRVAFDPHERDVRLLEGQALFQVAKDKSRPFIVDTGTARIRAVGTEFDVRQEGAQTTVSVLEGTVAVFTSQPATTSAGPALPANLMVTAGEQAVVTPQGRSKPRAANVETATAWTRGQLEFDETPLTEVAEAFNRASPRPLVLNGAIAADIRISGVYSSVDPHSLILFLRRQRDLDVRESPDQILVTAKAR